MLKGIKRDKWRHFIVGVVMGLALQGLLVWLFPAYVFIGSIIVFIIISVVSYAFELISLIIKIGHHDILDAVAGAAGGLVAMAAILIIRYW